MNLISIMLLIGCSFYGASLFSDPYFPPECPRNGTMQLIEEPARWADLCFQAVNGRLPTVKIRGESSSLFRDIDLDGKAELLEVRGVGNALKQIYIFKETTRGYRYLGELSANMDFTVGYDAENTLVILNVYRAGMGKVYLQTIQYKNRMFSVVEETLKR